MKSALRRSEELGDDDIIEVMKPPVRSGTYAAVRPPPLPRRERPLPRFDSVSDGIPTGVSEITSALARLSDAASLPRLLRRRDEKKREPAEALILTFIEENMTVQAIVGMSPLGEESTLRLLAKLVVEGTITLVD
jgi:hypothetical protein